MRHTVLLLAIAIGCVLSTGCETGPSTLPQILSFTASGPAEIKVGSTGQFAAFVTYADGTQADVTKTATWMSEPGLLTFIPNTGLATASGGTGGIQVRAYLPPRLTRSEGNYSSLVDVVVLEEGR